MASTFISSILDELELKASEFEVDDLEILNMELRYLRTFFLCACNHSRIKDSACLANLEAAVRSYGQILLRFLSTPEDPCFQDNLPTRVIDFRAKIGFLVPAVRGLYAELSSCSSESIVSPPVEEVKEFMTSLVDNLVDILILHRFRIRRFQELTELIIEPLKEKIKFLKNLIQLAVLREVEETQMAQFLIHCQVVGVNAARLSYMAWFDRSHSRIFAELQLKFTDLMHDVKPIDSSVRETYIQVLTALNLSGTSLVCTMKRDKWILGDFVYSLLGNLWELLLDDGTSFMECGKHQMQILYGGLKFLGKILRKQQEKFHGLDAHTKDLVGAVINEAGVLIFSVYTRQMDGESVEGMVHVLCGLLEKIGLIKAEVTKHDPVKSSSNFPTTIELKFIDRLLKNLRELESCNVDSLSSVLVIVQKVQEDLLFLRSFSEYTTQQRNQHETVQAFQRHVIEVAYEAECVIDSLMVGDVSHSSQKWFNAVAEKIQSLKTEAMEIDMTKYDFGVQKSCKTSRDQPIRETLPTMNEVVVGFDDDAKAVIDLLTRGSKQLDVVSIVGMPGQGKTTLAKKIFHDASIVNHFHILAWGCISQEYDQKKLLTEILVCVSHKHHNQYSMMSEDDMREELYRCLKGNRYLIVLDDVWDIESFKTLEILFSNNAYGSRILLTTRNDDVAFGVTPTCKRYEIRPLSFDESWELLQKKLMRREELSPELQVLGMQIARNCKGLPLSIVLVAGILATLDQVVWQEVAERVSSTVCSTDDCMDILELSYAHLPDHTKPVLLYIATFPEDRKISVRRLILLLTAEDFLLGYRLGLCSHVALSYLYRRNLVMPGGQCKCGAKHYCRVHDLIREFCVAKTKQERFVQWINGYEELVDFDEQPDLCRLCIYSRPEHFGKSRLFCPRLRSLTFFCVTGGRYERSCNLSFLYLLKHLRVLNLEEFNVGYVFPSEITVLVQLWFLAIKGMMREIPAAISNLSNLETFFVRGDPRNKYLSFPDTIWDMQKLRYVVVKGNLIDLSLPQAEHESSSSLCDLITFSTPRFYLEESLGKILRKFPNVQKLKLHLSDNVSPCKRILDLNFLWQLWSLKLTLRGMELDAIEFHFPSSLREVTLEGASPGILTKLGKLPKLEVLKVTRLFDDLEIWEMEEGDFPKLIFLKLDGNIVRWTGSGDHFPRLENLVLSECVKLVELPSCLKYIPTLELIQLHYCRDSVVGLVREIEEEQKCYGNEDFQVFISRK